MDYICDNFKVEWLPETSTVTRAVVSQITAEKFAAQARGRLCSINTAKKLGFGVTAVTMYLPRWFQLCPGDRMLVLAPEVLRSKYRSPQLGSFVVWGVVNADYEDLDEEEKYERELAADKEKEDEDLAAARRHSKYELYQSDY